MSDRNWMARQFEPIRDFAHGRSISGSILVNTGAAALTAASSIVFARSLRLADFGLYVYVVSTIGLIGNIAALGLPAFVTRELAVRATTGEWKLFNGLLRFGLLLPLVSSLLFAVFLICSSPFLGLITQSPGYYSAITVGAGIMVIQAVDLATSGSLQGMHLIVRSLIPQGLVVPFCLISYALAAHFGNLTFNAVHLLSVQFSVGLVLALVQITSLFRNRPRAAKGIPAEIRATLWLRSSLPFLGSGILFLVNTQADTLLLGFFRGSASAGVYQVGTRSAQLVVLSLGAIATAVQPRIASLHAAGNQVEIARIVTQTTRLAFGMAIAIACLLLASGRVLITGLFGKGFLPAVGVLFVLVLARLVNAGVGALGPYLAMTGKERLLFFGAALETALNVVLNILLIPRWGLMGSAFATGFSMALVNSVQALYVYKKWGIDTSVFGVSKVSSALTAEGIQ